MRTHTFKLDDAKSDDLEAKGASVKGGKSEVIRRALEQYEPEPVPLAPSRRPLSSAPDGRGVLRKAMRYQPHYATLRDGWGEERATEMLLEQLAPAPQYVALGKLDVGTVVVRGGDLYVLASKTLPGIGGKPFSPLADPEEVKAGKPVCGLRSLEGDSEKLIRVDPGERVEIPSRLDPRVPVEFLSLTVLESKAIGALAAGSCDLRQLYVVVTAREKGRDSRLARPSRNELLALAGKLMLYLVSNDLAVYTNGGDPLVSMWSLTPRGKAASKTLDGGHYEL